MMHLDITNKHDLSKTVNAIKLLHKTYDAEKEDGLNQLNQLLEEKAERLEGLGYDLVVFKELTSFVEFETGRLMKLALDILETQFFDIPKHWDELAETLILRVAKSNDIEVCQPCLEKLSSLLDYFDHRIAKHSKQILRLADLNDKPDLNTLYAEIVEKVKERLPRRVEQDDEEGGEPSHS